MLIDEMKREAEWLDIPVVLFAQHEDRDLRLSKVWKPARAKVY
ncbi:MAG: hypothetical protein R2864_03975 [Syntrophotaleaceae bacterium]